MAKKSYQDQQSPFASYFLDPDIFSGERWAGHVFHFVFFFFNHFLFPLELRKSAPFVFNGKGIQLYMNEVTLFLTLKGWA